MNRIVLTAVALLNVATGSYSSFAGERTAGSACEVSDLSEVFREPLKYAGRVFCGQAFFYAGQRVYGFYDKRVDETSFPGVKYPILLPGNVRPQQLDALRTGDRVTIKGILRPDEFCFVAENRCTPFNKPIDIDDLAIEPTA